MNKEVKYISYEESLSIYAKMIDASDGGLVGVRDEGGILASLDFVQNDMYYPDFADKLCYLVFKFCSGHYFNDGNKRIALTLGAYFLYKLLLLASDNVYASDGVNRLSCCCIYIDQNLLLRIMTCFMNGEDYDEELKMNIANAMSKGELGVRGEDYE